MYIPIMFRMQDQQEILDFMRANPFAIVVSVQDGVPVATHIPVSIAIRDDEVVLHAHFSKANPQCKDLADGEAMVIFTGAHAYISPTHYDKHESVPTWNYMAVHAYGNAKLVRYDDQPQAIEEMLDELITTYEASYLDHWHELSDKYRQGMMHGIIGFEMTITRIDAKAKLSQNKYPHEQERIADALLTHQDSSAVALGEAMKKHVSSGD